MKNPGKVRARTYGTKSPSRSEALRFIDSAKSPSTIIDGSLVNSSLQTSVCVEQDAVAETFRRRAVDRFLAPWCLVVISKTNPTPVTSQPENLFCGCLISRKRASVQCQNRKGRDHLLSSLANRCVMLKRRIHMNEKKRGDS